MREQPWSVLSWVAAGGLVCAALLLGGQATLPREFTASPPPREPSYWDAAHLALAAVIGVVVTAVHRRYHRDKPLPRSLGQAQVLLCVSGAMMMMIIGDSVARAFGVAGAASIIRFRTPVEDPKDTTILFLLLGLGMASGVGSYWVAGLGTVFLCLLLAALDYFQETYKPRVMMLEVVADGAQFPTEHVQRVLGASAEFYEPREVAHGKEATIRYQVTLDPHTSLAYLSQELISGGTAGVKAVSWEAPKKSETG